MSVKTPQGPKANHTPVFNYKKGEKAAAKAAADPDTPKVLKSIRKPPLLLASPPHLPPNKKLAALALAPQNPTHDDVPYEEIHSTNFQRWQNPKYELLAEEMGIFIEILNGISWESTWDQELTLFLPFVQSMNKDYVDLRKLDWSLSGPEILVRNLDGKDFAPLMRYFQE